MRANFNSGSTPSPVAPRRKLCPAFCVTVLAVSLGSCVASEKPLLVGTTPIVGPQPTAQLFRKFSDGKAHEMRMTSFTWQDGAYVNTGNGATEVARFVAETLQSDDSLIQSTDTSGKLFRYWIGRKITPGAYLIFPLDEASVDDALRGEACAKGQPAGICIVDNKTQLIALAEATAARPVKDGEIAVVVDHDLGIAADKPAIQ